MIKIVGTVMLTTAFASVNLLTNKLVYGYHILDNSSAGIVVEFTPYLRGLDTNRDCHLDLVLHKSFGFRPPVSLETRVRQNVQQRIFSRPSTERVKNMGLA